MAVKSKWFGSFNELIAVVCLCYSCWEWTKWCAQWSDASVPMSVTSWLRLWGSTNSTEGQPLPSQDS